MDQSVGLEFSKVPWEDSWRKICASGHKFHVMTCFTGQDPNGFHIFHLPCITPTPFNLWWTNHLDWRSPRCPERARDAKSVRRGTNFMSWAASLDGIPMDFIFFTFNASIQPQLIWNGPISWIGGLQGALRGLMTSNLCVGMEISLRCHERTHEHTNLTSCATHTQNIWDHWCRLTSRVGPRIESPPTQQVVGYVSTLKGYSSSVLLRKEMHGGIYGNFRLTNLKWCYDFR